MQNSLAGDISTETKPFTCERHGDYEAVVVCVLGSTKKYSSCPVCKEEQKAKAKLDAEREEQFNRRGWLAEAKIPSRFKDCSLENYEATTPESAKVLATCKRYVETYELRKQRGEGMVLCGKPGTGKTHLAIAVARDVCMKHGDRPLFTDLLTIFRQVKSTYNKNSQETEEQVIQRFCNVPFLVIDEAGVQFDTETEKLIAFEIFNRRYGNMLPTVVISNLSKVELTQVLGARVIDRVTDGGAVLAFDWESYRGQRK